MTDTMTHPEARVDAPLEKTPLETYVPPARPSLIGLSRDEIGLRLEVIGVPAA